MQREWSRLHVSSFAQSQCRKVILVASMDDFELQTDHPPGYGDYYGVGEKPGDQP
jgi:hypothetical protein